jgi:hypothetical protein
MKGGGPPERRPTLHKSSPAATTHLKIETVCAHYNVTDTICLQNVRAKLKEEGLLFKSFCKSNMGNIENFMKRISNAKEHPAHEFICLLGKKFLRLVPWNVP